MNELQEASNEEKMKDIEKENFLDSKDVIDKE